MNRRRISLLLPLAVFAALATGCPTKKDSDGDNAVHDDIWVASGAGPARIILDGDIAWISNFVANSVDAVDLTTCGSGEESCDGVATVNLETSAGPFDGVVANGSLYVVKTGIPGVAVIDTTTRQLVATITTGAGGAFTTPQAAAFAADTLFVADSNFYGSGPGYIAMVDGTSIIGTIATTQLQPAGFAMLPDGDLAVTNNGYVDFAQMPAIATSAGGIDVIDPASGVVVNNVDLGLTSPICRPAVLGNVGYTASGTEGTLMRVVLDTGVVTETSITDADSFLTWTHIEDGRLYVLSSNEDRVYVFDAASGDPIDLGDGDNFVSVGPGGETPKGPSHAVVWEDADGVKHLLVVMALANSVTDIVLDELFPE